MVDVGHGFYPIMEQQRKKQEQITIQNAMHNLKNMDCFVFEFDELTNEQTNGWMDGCRTRNTVFIFIRSF